MELFTGVPGSIVAKPSLCRMDCSDFVLRELQNHVTRAATFQGSFHWPCETNKSCLARGNNL